MRKAEFANNQNIDRTESLFYDDGKRDIKWKMAYEASKPNHM